MKKTSFLLPVALLIMLAAAMNAAAQINSSGSGAVPGPDVYAPGYTPKATPLPDVSSTPAADTHVPESTSLIVGSIMLVPLAVSFVRVFRRRHVLS